MKGLKIYIPTLGREGRQITLQYIPNKLKKYIYLVCPKEEKHNWKNRINVPKECIGSISKTRQWILENSDAKYVGFFDDDIVFQNRKKDKSKTVKNSKKDNYFMVKEFYKLMETGIHFSGMIHRFMFHEKDFLIKYGKPAHCYFIDKNFMMENNIRFDVLDYYSDFHIPISILENGGKVRYLGKYIANEVKPNAKGGCSINRTAEKNRNSVFKLKELHPDFITLKDKPGHKNQNLVINVQMFISWKKLYEHSLSVQKNKYNKKGYKALDIDAMTYGCELEIADCDTSIRLPIGKWDMKDGSVANSNGIANDPKKEFNIYGGEINTDPTKRIVDQLTQIRTIYKTLKNYSFNHTTNLHIHIRVPGLKENLDMVKKLQSYIFEYSKDLLEYIEPIPEADKSLRGKDYELAKRREKRRKRSHHWAISKVTYERLMESKTIEEFFDNFYPRSKNGKINYAGATRAAINVLQLKETDTIEFRHFTCTDNLEELFYCFLFCRNFIIAGLTDQKNPIEMFKEGNYKFPKFWDFNPKIEEIFLKTNVVYNTRKQVLENINKIKEKENAE